MRKFVSFIIHSLSLRKGRVLLPEDLIVHVQSKSRDSNIVPLSQEQARSANDSRKFSAFLKSQTPLINNDEVSNRVMDKIRNHDVPK